MPPLGKAGNSGTATMKLQVPPTFRFSATGLWRTRPRDRAVVVGVLIGVAAVLVLSLLIPGRTYSGQHSFDLIVWLDGAYRAAAGQVSSRDFATPFGPLTYTLLGWAYLLSGSVGALMPTNTALYALILLPLLLYCCLSRLPLLVTLIFGCHLIILVVAPANIGDTFAVPTFAMFYNRFGWALLSLLTLMVLPRRAGSGSIGLDAVVMAALWAMMFYTKISFAAVATALLLGFLIVGHLRRAALGAMILVVAILVVVEVFWGQTFTYLHDVAATAAVSGSVQGGVGGIAFTFLRNAFELELFAGVLGLALLRGVRLEYLLIALLIGAAGVFVANQNSQGPGIPPFIPAALAVLLAPRREDAAEDRLLPFGLLLTLALVVPGDLFALAVQASHVHSAAVAPADSGVNVTLDGLMGPLETVGTTGIGPAREACAPYDHGTRDLLPPAHLPWLSQGLYLATVKDGAELLGRDPALRGAVSTLDFGNPFNALLHRRPVVGGNQWNHFGRNFDLRTHLPPDRAFGDAAVIMVPHRPAVPPTVDILGELYGPYIATHFVLGDRSMCWDAFVRRGGKRG